MLVWSHITGSNGVGESALPIAKATSIGIIQVH